MKKDYLIFKTFKYKPRSKKLFRIFHFIIILGIVISIILALISDYNNPTNEENIYGKLSINLFFVIFLFLVFVVVYRFVKKPYYFTGKLYLTIDNIIIKRNLIITKYDLKLLKDIKIYWDGSAGEIKALLGGGRVKSGFDNKITFKHDGKVYDIDFYCDDQRQHLILLRMIEKWRTHNISINLN